MVSIENLRYWAGLTAGDASKDAVLRLIEDGLLSFIGTATNHILRCPPVAFTEILDVAPVDSGGLSGEGATTNQRLRLLEEPRRTLTGTGTVAPGGTTLAGTGTRFTEQLDEDPASAVTIAGQPILIDVITDDVTAELAEAHVEGAAGAVISIDVISIERRALASEAWETLDPRNFEYQGREIFTADEYLHAGSRTARVVYLVGNEEGENPPGNQGAGIVLVLLQMVKSVYTEIRRRGQTIDLDGAFSITYADLGDEAEAYEKKLCALRRPLGYG